MIRRQTLNIHNSKNKHKNSNNKQHIAILLLLPNDVIIKKLTFWLWKIMDTVMWRLIRKHNQILTDMKVPRLLLHRRMFNRRTNRKQIFRQWKIMDTAMRRPIRNRINRNGRNKRTDNNMLLPLVIIRTVMKMRRQIIIIISSGNNSNSKMPKNRRDSKYSENIDCLVREITFDDLTENGKAKYLSTAYWYLDKPDCSGRRILFVDAERLRMDSPLSCVSTAPMFPLWFVCLFVCLFYFYYYFVHPTDLSFTMHTHILIFLLRSLSLSGISFPFVVTEHSRPHTDQFPVCFYNAMNALEDIQTQFHGAVLVIFLLGNSMRRPIDRKCCMESQRIMDVVPITWASCHFCYEDKIDKIFRR